MASEWFLTSLGECQSTISISSTIFILISAIYAYVIRLV